jgi:hypothetical protein
MGKTVWRMVTSAFLCLLLKDQVGIAKPADYVLRCYRTVEVIGLPCQSLIYLQPGE